MSAFKKIALVGVGLMGGSIIHVLSKLPALIAPTALVTDVGSVKARICKVAAEVLPGLGGHPMTGSERHHDRIVAYVSHLPQLLAVTLADLVAQQNQHDTLYTHLAAGGFRNKVTLQESVISGNTNEGVFLGQDVAATLIGNTITENKMNGVVLLDAVTRFGEITCGV